MPYYPTIVYSPGVQAGAAPPAWADEIIAALAASDAPFEVVPDICEFAAGSDPAMRRWSAATDLRIAGLPRRAVKWLFHAAGQALPETAQVLDPGRATPDEIVRGLLAGRNQAGDAAKHGQDARAPSPAEAMTVVLYEGPGARAMTAWRRAELIQAAVAAGYRVFRPAPDDLPPAGGHQGPASDTLGRAIVGDFEGGNIPPGLTGAGAVRIDAGGKCVCGAIGAVGEARAVMGLPKPGQWAAWFPVIDYDRCAGCEQCANFCLFGVYSTDDGVWVANPSACKTNCPACARMCPHGAIIFPHYPTGPINGRDASEQGGAGDAAASLKEALRGDVYQVLRSRQGGAASLAATAAAKAAGAAGSAGLGGLAGLEKVAEQFEIHPQALMSLSVSGSPASAACNCQCGADAACDGGRRAADEPSADCQRDCACDCGGDAEGDNCDCDCDDTTTGSGRCCCQSDGAQPETPLQ